MEKLIEINYRDGDIEIIDIPVGTGFIYRHNKKMGVISLKTDLWFKYNTDKIESITLNFLNKDYSESRVIYDMWLEMEEAGETPMVEEETVEEATVEEHRCNG